MTERKRQGIQQANFTQYSLWEQPLELTAAQLLDLALQAEQKKQEREERDGRDHSHFMEALTKSPLAIAAHVTYVAFDTEQIEEARNSTVPTRFFVASTRLNNEQVYVPGIVLEREGETGGMHVMIYGEYASADPVIALDAIVQVFPRQQQHEATPGHIYHPRRRSAYPQTEQGVHDWQQAAHASQFITGILSREIFRNIDASRRQPRNARNG